MKLISRERFWSARGIPGSLLSSCRSSSTISDLRISPSTLSGLGSIALEYRLLLRSSIELNNVSFISCCGILIVVVFWLLLYFDCCFRQTSMRCKHLGHFWLSFLNFFHFLFCEQSFLWLFRVHAWREFWLHFVNKSLAYLCMFFVRWLYFETL